MSKSSVRFVLGFFVVSSAFLACTCNKTSEEDKFWVGLVPDGGGTVDDNTFNQSAYEGGMRAVRELGIYLDFAQPMSEENFNQQIEQFVDRDFDLIVSVGFQIADATLEEAEKHPDFKFAIIDCSYEKYPDNLTGLVFREDQAGYLAGILAAKMTSSKKVGCLGGIDIPPVKKFCNGYRQGIAAHCNDCEIEIVYVGAFDDVEKGEQAAQDFIDEGFDVIFGVAGLTGSGGILYAAKHGEWVIGVDMDEYLTTFQNGEEPGVDKLLTSAMKRVDVAVYETIKATLEENFHSGTVTFSAANDGIGLAPFHKAEDAIQEDVKTLLEQSYDALADGTLDTKVDDQGDIID